jgi:ketosteroid isomerase-like protein
MMSGKEGTIMTDTVKQQIQALVDLETKGWNTKNPDLFLSIIHPDMVWPWPPTAYAYDPVEWVFVMGRFDRERWRKNWQDIFDSHDLIHNRRETVKIEISREKDGAFAVVDIDTLWRHKKTKEDFLWKGRVCKIYTKMSTGEWKFIFQTGALDFSRISKTEWSEP